MEIDYAWWITKHISKKLGKNLAVLKTRRAGFSYKEAADSIYNYNFFAGSKSYIYASQLVFLTGDRIMDKVTEGLDFLNEHTVWFKNRQVKNTTLHRKASYLERTTEKGFKSEIIGQVLDNPNKARGGGATKITFEEAGSFKDLLMAWEVCSSQMKENGIVVGQQTAFGTGGEMGDGLIGLETLFYNPEKYDILPFNNIWDGGMEGTTCGFFVPCIDTFDTKIGDSGIVDKGVAKEFYDIQRAKKGKGNDSSALDKYVAEQPFTPREALMRLNSNIFPSVLCQQQELFVEQNKSLQESILYGEVYETKDETGVKVIKFRPNKTKQDAVNIYPIDKGFKKDGAVTIYQTPYYEADNIYFAVLDPYVADDAPESASVGACYIYKRASAILVDKDRPADCIVAAYIARPSTADEYIKNVFLLAQYYKAKIYFEVQGGGEAVRNYAKNHNLMHYLAFQPIHLTNKEVVSYKNRSFGININVDLKKTYLKAFADWLIKERELTDEGYVLNLNLIYDIGLLKELSKFNPDKGNFDRVSACILIAILMEDIVTEDIRTNKIDERDKFFNKAIFSNTSTGNSFIGYATSEYLQ